MGGRAGGLGRGQLASCLIRLGKFADAVEAARKANFSRTWKEVLVACVNAQEFRLAQMCGLNLMHVPDEVEELIKVYERRGYFDQLIAMMESVRARARTPNSQPQPRSPKS